MRSNLKPKLLKLLTFAFRRKAIWLRGMISWGIGIAVLIIAPDRQFDYRYQLRGPQDHSPNIVLLHLSSTDIKKYHNKQSLQHWYYKETNLDSERYYWDYKLWKTILTRLQQMQVHKVGISFFFSNDIVKNHQKDPLFLHEDFVWAASKDREGRTLLPAFINSARNNFAFSQLQPDIDGIVRHLPYRLSVKSGLGFQLSRNKQLMKEHEKNAFINYRGKSGTFSTISLDELLSYKKTDTYLKDKTIIIGTRSLTSHIMQTPLGKMSLAEITANIVDNNQENRWIQNLKLLPSVMYLFLILIVSIWVMSIFPQSMALIYLIWMGAGVTAVSIALFDDLNFWVPTLAPLLQIVSTYILFISYQLTVKDYINWKLGEEQKLQTQTQQLKNNFVSLISHDLKTPIAKMQGICDRLLSSDPNNKFSNDLMTLRNETQELNRYIQSILQITKLESQSFKLHKEPCDINKVIEKVLSHLKFMLIDKSMEVNTELDPLFLIEVDPILIYEVILNIIENSIKYSNGGLIHIKTYETDTHVHIIIKDTGPGIASDELEHIFEKFYRSKDQKQKTKGSGLGLYLVKYFIQLHGGNINIDSQLGEGTQVNLKLPIS